jgi:phage nucleotide-binding protein
MIEVKNTSLDKIKCLNILVYGTAGTGKTYAIESLPNPIVINAEKGLLTLQNKNIDYIDIKSMSELSDVYEWLKFAPEAQKYQSIAIDSLSEISEFCLERELELAKDPRQAYGELKIKMRKLINLFKELDKHKYIITSLDLKEDEFGKPLYSPMIPGSFTKQISHYFDVVMSSQKIDGEYAFRCIGNYNYIAKDRSSKLKEHERQNLSDIIKKVVGE